MYLSNDVYFVGFTTKVSRPDLVAEPMAPSNFKDPVKIREKIEEKKDLLRPQLITCPGIATITSIDIYNWKAKSVFSASCQVDSPFNPPAIKFWDWFNNITHVGFNYIFGFRIRTFLQIAAVEAVIFNESDSKPSVKIPVQVWRDYLGVYDPYEAMFTEEQRKIVSLGSAISLLLGDAVDEESLYQKPRTQAMLAHRMTLRGQLLGADPDSYIGKCGLGYAENQEDTKVGSPREAGAAARG